MRFAERIENDVIHENEIEYFLGAEVRLQDPQPQPQPQPPPKPQLQPLGPVA